MIFRRLKQSLRDGRLASGDICAIRQEGDAFWVPCGDGCVQRFDCAELDAYFEPEEISESEAARWLAELASNAQSALRNQIVDDPTRTLSPAIKGNSIAELRNLAHGIKREVIARSELVLVARVKRLSAAFAEARRAELEAALAPLKAYLERLEEVVWTVNLYLGRDEQVRRIASGASAPAGDPLVIRQRVLAMDEEIALSLWNDFDFAQIEAFDDWVKDPVNLAQVLPESKGVVVLAVRGSAKDYKGVDPFTGAILNRENAKTYWLCRNGENLYRIWADIQVGDLLYPQSNAAVSRFKPGSREYYQSLKRAGKGQKDFSAMDWSCRD